MVIGVAARFPFFKTYIFSFNNLVVGFMTLVRLVDISRKCLPLIVHIFLY